MLTDAAGLRLAAGAAGCVDGGHDRRDVGVPARQVRSGCARTGHDAGLQFTAVPDMRGGVRRLKSGSLTQVSVP
jgi:hypothetical protein